MSTERARIIARQCWCDEETRDTEMDVRLAEAFAKRYEELLVRIDSYKEDLCYIADQQS